MKKSWKVSLLAAVTALAFFLGGCEAYRVCIGHIDRDNNGKCDNCNQTMTQIKSNVETLEIKVTPQKNYYAFNEKLDYSDGVLRVTYNDGTPTAEIPFTDSSVKVVAPNMSVAGKKNVAVTYNGKTVKYQIEVGVRKYKVSFDLGYDGGEQIEEQHVNSNGYAQAPETPQREGYDFLGWFADSQFESEFDFQLTNIIKDTTVYANWIKRYKVTYAANYTGGADEQRDSSFGKITDFTPEKRDSYKFSGWFYDPECKRPVDYDVIIDSDITLYAGWVSDVVNFYTVTFNHNYGETPVTESREVAENSQATPPATPKRANVSAKGHQAQDFTFGGWYKDAGCTQKYDFSAAVTEDMTLYAKWTGTYIFEAEHVSFFDEDGTPLQGVGASGETSGTDMIETPPQGAEGVNASNDRYVTYLYAEGLALVFNIVSDREVEDATLVFRISCENKGFALDWTTNEGKTSEGLDYSKYSIILNDDEIEYETIIISDAAGHEDTGGKRPFSDVVIATHMSLKKGDNKLTFLTANSHGMGGTMAATAPVIDCIKITTSANLDWTPLLENEF